MFITVDIKYRYAVYAAQKGINIEETRKCLPVVNIIGPDVEIITEPKVQKQGQKQYDNKKRKLVIYPFGPAAAFIKDQVHIYAEQERAHDIGTVQICIAQKIDKIIMASRPAVHIEGQRFNKTCD